MARQTVIIKVKSINKSGDLQVNIESVNFSTKESSQKAVEKIHFFGDKTEIENKLRDGQTYELEYNSEDIKEKESGGHFVANKSAGTAKASSETTAMGSASSGKREHEIDGKELKIWDISAVAVKQKTTNLDEKGSKLISQEESDTAGSQGGTHSASGTAGKTASTGDTTQTHTSGSSGKQDSEDTSAPSQEESAKRKQEIEENLRKTKNATGDDLQEQINKNDKDEHTPEYQENRKNFEEEKRRAAREGAEKYRKNVTERIKNKLSENGISKDDLDTDSKTAFEELENGTETNEDKIVEKEVKVLKNIGEEVAKKKFEELEKEVKEALKSKDEQKIKSCQSKTSDFLKDCNSNIYLANYKSKAQDLQGKLKNNSKNNSSTDNGGFPWKPVLIGGGAIAGVLVLIAIVARKRRKSDLE
jgi:hypothetical protein